MKHNNKSIYYMDDKNEINIFTLSIEKREKVLGNLHNINDSKFNLNNNY